MAESAADQLVPPSAASELAAWWMAEMRALFRVGAVEAAGSSPLPKAVLGRKIIRFESDGETSTVEIDRPLSTILAGALRNKRRKLILELAPDRWVKRELASQRLPFETAYRMAMLDVAANTPFAPDAVHILLPKTFDQGISFYFLVRRDILDDVIATIASTKWTIDRIVMDADGRKIEVAPYAQDQLQGTGQGIFGRLRHHAFGLMFLLAIGVAFFNIQSSLSDASRVVENQIEATEPAAAKARREFKLRNDYLAKLATFATAKKQYRPLVYTLEELSSRLPDGTYVTSLSVQDKMLRLSGFSAASAALIPELSASKLFDKPHFTSAIVKVPGREGEQFGLELEVGNDR